MYTTTTKFNTLVRIEELGRLLKPVDHAATMTAALEQNKSPKIFVTYITMLFPRQILTKQKLTIEKALTSVCRPS